MILGPQLRRVSPEFDPAGQTTVVPAENPLSHVTLGAAGPVIEVRGPDEFPLTPLVIPFVGHEVIGLNVTSIRVFRLENGQFTPIWSSGVNQTLGYFWANIRRPGLFLPIGLPRDVLVLQSLRKFDLELMLSDGGGSPGERHKMLRNAFAILFDGTANDLDQLRSFLTRMEIQTGPGLATFAPYEYRFGKGGHTLPFPFPHGVDLGELRRQIEALKIPPDGLPEQQLFRVPEMYGDARPPWTLSTKYQDWNGIPRSDVGRLEIWRELDLEPEAVLPWMFPKNWWMQQHDPHHSGEASGGSNINSGTAGRMFQQSAVCVDGPVLTKPSIVDGKIYVGTGNTSGSDGTLYRIDLATGAVEKQFPTSTNIVPFFPWSGIGGSPTVTADRIYFSTVYGSIYCLDRDTFTQLWMTNLVVPDEKKRQPVSNPNFSSWSGPLVEHGRVYVSGGEGESPTTFGMIFCLDAATGVVLWLFCTNKFVDPMISGHENEPNVIPQSAAVGYPHPLPKWAIDAGFRTQADPPATGASPWSSFAYDAGLDRIYIGTGNSEVGPQHKTNPPLPNERYGCGLLSLDAATGEYRGFFQMVRSDSYWPGDLPEGPPNCPLGEDDVDVPSPPTLYTNSHGQRVLCFGSKNGSFFIVDADTLDVVARRQLLPKKGGTGLPGDVGTPIFDVVPLGSGNPPSCENKWGVFASAAVDSALGRLFVGVGGYVGVAAPQLTPFMRALDWNDLRDVWITEVGPDDVSRYITTTPPMYLTTEAGLSAPAVVNDVVFISTSGGMDGQQTALYSFDARTGICLWSASSASLGGQFSLGPAIYGDYVVLGAGDTVYIYRLRDR